MNEEWQTAFARMRPEGIFANSNCSRYLKGQSRPLDRSMSAEPIYRTRMHGGESKTANRICIDETLTSDLSNSTKASHPDRQPTEEELKSRGTLPPSGQVEWKEMVHGSFPFANRVGRTKRFCDISLGGNNSLAGRLAGNKAREQGT